MCISGTNTGNLGLISQKIPFCRNSCYKEEKTPKTGSKVTKQKQPGPRPGHNESKYQETIPVCSHVLKHYLHYMVDNTHTVSYSIYSELSNQLPAGKITNNELYKSSGLVATFFGKSSASKKSVDFSPLSRCRITPLRGTQVENRFFTVSVPIPRHPVIVSDDDWGLQPPPKRIVLRFHYHSQFRWLDP